MQPDPESAKTFESTRSNQRPFRTNTPPLVKSSEADTQARIGRYQVVRELGRGGMGVVYECVDAVIGRSVAIKVVLPHKAKGNARVRFEIEGKLGGRLEHPHIMPVHEFGEHQGMPYLVMKYVKGKSLLAAVKQGMKFRERIEAFARVCEAMRFAHSRGIIHRDLKPDNVMLGQLGEVLVADWGLAKLVTETSSENDGEVGTLASFEKNLAAAETMDGAILGTPSYMSPEQARGDIQAVGESSDIYSLGAILYYLLTGTPPFQGKDSLQVVGSVRKGRIESPSARVGRGKVSRELEAVCLKAMAKDPHRRYHSVADLLVEIESWLKGERVLAYRYTWWERLVLEVKRYPSLTVLFAMSWVVLLVAGLFASMEAGSRAKAAEAESQHQVEKERAGRLELEKLAQNGKLVELASELGVQLKARRSVLADEYSKLYQEARVQGLSSEEFYAGLGPTRMAAYTQAFEDLVATDIKFGTQMTQVEDYMSLGGIYSGFYKDDVRALEYTERALRTFGNGAKLQALRSFIFLNMKAFEMSEKAARAGLALDSKYYLLWGNLGAALYGQHKLKDSATAYEAAAESCTLPGTRDRYHAIANNIRGELGGG